MDKAPWFVTNAALHEDLNFPSINQTAATFYQGLHFKIQGHLNQLIFQLHSKSRPGNPTRRLNQNSSERPSQKLNYTNLIFM